MQVGVYCSSNRPQYWSGIIKMLSNNSVDWNLCIAGPNPPIEPLPGNVKWIQTNVKPAQCWFIAAHNTTGDYVMRINDDELLSPGCLDDMVKLIEGKKDTVVSPFFMPDGNIKNKNIRSHYSMWDARGYLDGDSRATKKNGKYFGIGVELNFPLPFADFIRRDNFNKTGIDKYFVGVWWNYDMCVEIVSKGGQIIISENSYGYDFRGGVPGLSQMGHDLLYMADMWIDQAIINGPDKKVRTVRKKPIEPLIYNDTVSTVSQGLVYPPPLEKGGIYEVPSSARMTPAGWI